MSKTMTNRVERFWFEGKPMAYKFMSLRKPLHGVPTLELHAPYPRSGCWAQGLAEIKKARDWLDKVIRAIERHEEWKLSKMPRKCAGCTYHEPRTEESEDE